MNYYVCRRMKLMSYLTKKGFMFTATLPDMHNPKYHVWLYEDSEELRAVVEEYYTTKPI